MRTIEWDDGVVRMIDQRKLPGQYVVVDFRDYRQVAHAIREMYIRGAPAIGAAAAFGLALAARQSQAATSAELMTDLNEAAEVLRATRPTAVNLFWALDRMLKKAHHFIDILKGNPRSGGDDRLFRACNSFQERPIRKRATCDLYNIEIMFFDEIHGLLIERGTNGRETMGLYFIAKHLILVR